MENTQKSPTPSTSTSVTNQSQETTTPTVGTTNAGELVPGKGARGRALSPKSKEEERARLKLELEEVKTCNLERLDELAKDPDYQAYMKSPEGMRMLLAVTEADLREFAGDEEIPADLLVMVNMPKTSRVPNPIGYPKNSDELKAVLESIVAGTVQGNTSSTPTTSKAHSSSALALLLESPESPSKGQHSPIQSSLTNKQSQLVTAKHVIGSNGSCGLMVSEGDHTNSASKPLLAGVLDKDPVGRASSLQGTHPGDKSPTNSSVVDVLPMISPRNSPEKYIRRPSTDTVSPSPVRSSVEMNATNSQSGISTHSFDEAHQSPSKLSQTSDSSISPTKTIDIESSQESGTETGSSQRTGSDYYSSSQGDTESQGSHASSIEIITLDTTPEASQSDEQPDNLSPTKQRDETNSDPEMPELKSHVFTCTPVKSQTISEQLVSTNSAPTDENEELARQARETKDAYSDSNKNQTKEVLSLRISPSMSGSIGRILNSSSPNQEGSQSPIEGANSNVDNSPVSSMEARDVRISSRRFPKRKSFGSQMSTPESPFSSNRRSTRLNAGLSSNISTSNQQTVDLEQTEGKLSVTNAESSKTEKLKTDDEQKLKQASIESHGALTTSYEATGSLDPMKMPTISTTVQSDSESDVDDKDVRQIRGKKSGTAKDDKTQNNVRVTRQSSPTKSPEKVVPDLKSGHVDKVTEEESEAVDSTGLKRPRRKRVTRLQKLKNQVHLFYGELELGEEVDGDEKRRTRASGRTSAGTSANSSISESTKLEVDAADGLTVRGLRKRPFPSGGLTENTPTGQTNEPLEVISPEVGTSVVLKDDEVVKVKTSLNDSKLKKALLEALETLVSQQHAEVFMIKRGGNPREDAVKKHINLSDVKEMIENGEIKTFDGLERNLTLMFLNFEMCYVYFTPPDDIKRVRTYMSSATKLMQKLNPQTTLSLVTPLANVTNSSASNFVTPKVSLKKGARGRSHGAPAETESGVVQKSEDDDESNEEQDMETVSVNTGKKSRAVRDSSLNASSGSDGKNLRSRPVQPQDTGRGRGGRRQRQSGRHSAT